MKMWKTTELDVLVAMELFGWKWMSFIGRPTRSHPEYCSRKDFRVRQFFSPESLANKQWKEWLAENDAQDATGDEPLSYAYCSSNGPAMVPHFSGSDDAFREAQNELLKRGLMKKFVAHLREVAGDTMEDIFNATCEQKCIAALLAVESKYVQEVKEEPTQAK